MNTAENNNKYEPWLSVPVMHKASNDWLSELEFIKIEQFFFDDLIKAHTLQLIDKKHYEESKTVVNQLSELQKETNLLLETVKKHESNLQAILGEKNQSEEKDIYKNIHCEIIISVSTFLKKYTTLKKQLFTLIKDIIKEEKQKRLLQ